MAESIVPVNKALVSIDNAFIDEITTSGGLKLYLDSSYNKEHNVASIGKVKYLSKSHKLEHNDVVEHLKEGDEIAFSYRVVADFTFAGDGGQFIDIMPDSPDSYKKYTNGKGEWLIKNGLPKKTFGKTWVAYHLNKRMELIAGEQGDESAVDRFMAQFNIGKTDKYVFNNLVNVDGEELWKVNYTEIFAKKGKNGNIIAVGDRVICEPIDTDLSNQIEATSGIVVPKMMMMARWQDRARIVTGCKSLGLNKGDIIGFDPKYLEKYTLWGKEYFIIKKRRVDFLWN
jgi:hypothetical protein